MFPQPLKIIATRCLERSITFENIFSFFDIAQRHKLPELLQAVDSLICQYFSNVVLTDHFLAISDRIMRWIVSNQEIVTSEACLLEALIRWYKHDERNREETFIDLFTFKINKDYISHEYLDKVLQKVNSLTKLSNPTKHCIVDVIMDAKYSNVAVKSCAPGHTSETQVTCWMPFMKQELRLPDNRAHVYSGIQGKSLGSLTSLLDSNVELLGVDDSNTKLEPEEGFGSSIQIGVYIYSIGGGKEKRNTSRYDTRTDSWATLSDMEESCHNPCVLSYRLNSIYVIGGLNTEETISGFGNVQRYDIRTDRWDVVATCLSPNVNRFNCQAAVYNDKIVVLEAPNSRTNAFLSGYNLCFTCYIYTPETNEWQSFCTPSTPTLAPDMDSALSSTDEPFFFVFYETLNDRFEQPLSETHKSFYMVNLSLCEPGSVPFVRTTFVGSKKLQLATDHFRTPVALSRKAFNAAMEQAEKPAEDD